MRGICGFPHPDKGAVSVLGKIVGKDRDFAPSTGIVGLNPESKKSVGKYLLGIESAPVHRAGYYGGAADPDTAQALQQAG